MASAHARDFAVDLGELHENLKLHIQAAQKHYQKAADNRRIPPPEFKIGQYAFMKAQFFQTTHPSKKLAEKNFGPYKIIRQSSPNSFVLCLLDSMHKVHPVHHISMLEPHTPSAILNRTVEPPQIDSEIEYEIVEILDTKLDRCQRQPLLYLVHWSGYEGTNEETSWLPADELSHAPKLISDFHKAYPLKPGPEPQ
jgi:hypothetical protein